MTDPRVPPSELLAHATFVRRLAVALLGDGADADDAAQETWARALAAPPRPGPRLEGWLATVLRNVVRRRARERGRRARREAAVAAPGSVADGADTVARAEILRRVADAVAGLDPASREVVLLRHFEGLPPRRIAARLALDVGAVKARLARAHARLRARLDEGRHGNVEAWRTALGAFLAGPGDGGTTTATAVGGGIPMASVGVRAGVGVALLMGGVAAIVGMAAGGGRDAPPATTIADRAPDARPGPLPTGTGPGRLAAAAAPTGVGAASANSAAVGAPVRDDPASVEVLVFDVVDGAPVPALGLRARANREQPWAAFTTDARGIARLPHDAVRGGTLEVTTAGWGGASRLTDGPGPAGFAVHRRVRVEGRVVVDGPGGPAAVPEGTVVRWTAIADRGASVEDVELRPGTPRWAVEHAPDALRAPVRVATDGTFEVEVPQVRRLAAVASAPGWTSAPAEVVPALDVGGVATVRLTLRRRPRLAGRFTTPDGAPVTTGNDGAPLRVTVLARTQWSRAPDPLDLVPSGGVVLRIGPGGRVSKVEVERVQVGSDGRFEVFAEPGVAVVLAASPKGFAPWFGTHDARSDAGDRTWTLVPAASRSVQIVRAGVPVTSPLSVVDVTDEDLQVEVGRLEPDGDGMADRTCLVAGRAYWVFGTLAGGPRLDAYFRATDAEVLDLTDPGSFSALHPPR